ncbi:uncharacterized protein LOC124162572 [Ischnura elegans]|uniref:uncharacterized protein LOC124162572 n=1 Tax=Ischnura elegans TaxID=197161 RepID=UPI001ED87B4E|nr:uncharacterized protein LOC124162572 [Ischnura elegans]
MEKIWLSVDDLGEIGALRYQVNVWRGRRELPEEVRPNIIGKQAKTSPSRRLTSWLNSGFCFLQRGEYETNEENVAVALRSCLNNTARKIYSSCPELTVHRKDQHSGDRHLVWVQRFAPSAVGIKKHTKKTEEILPHQLSLYIISQLYHYGHVSMTLRENVIHHVRNLQMKKKNNRKKCQHLSRKIHRKDRLCGYLCLGWVRRFVSAAVEKMKQTKTQQKRSQLLCHLIIFQRCLFDPVLRTVPAHFIHHARNLQAHLELAEELYSEDPGNFEWR